MCLFGCAANIEERSLFYHECLKILWSAPIGCKIVNQCKIYTAISVSNRASTNGKWKSRMLCSKLLGIAFSLSLFTVIFVKIFFMQTIGIICGGYSSEWEISLKSAQTIQDNFPKEFRVVKIVVDKSNWQVWDGDNRLPFDLNSCTFPSVHDASSRVKIDAAIVYIHGDPGENGKVQAFLEMQNIPYINSGPLASALSFDKWYCNQFLKGFGIHVAESLFLTSRADYSDQDIIDKLGLPVFVKPSDSGSSYGISKVKTVQDLGPALDKAFEEGKSVVVESFLDGVEVTCGVYRKKSGLHALPLTEIASENEYFDYEAKYLGKSQEITPARVEESVALAVQKQAKFIYELLQLRSISRIDFMIVGDVPYVIEVNTTPGFSPASIVPKMLACEGVSIQSFWQEIVEVEWQQKQN
jgi:D-alanine-D-alanine ligase